MVRQPKLSSSRNSIKGIGMIEILVTLVILAIGLMGVASLQYISALSHSDAMLRSLAVLVAEQLSERLRAAAKLSNKGDGLVVDNAYFVGDKFNFSGLSCTDSTKSDYNCFCLTIPASIPNCEVNTCTSAQTAQYDIHQLTCAAVQTYPLTEVSLSCNDKDTTDMDNCSAGSRYNILVRWPVVSWQNKDLAVNSVCNSSMTELYQCVSMELYL